MDTLREALARQQELHAAFAKKSLAFFLDGIVINSSPTPRRFGLAADPWQRELVRPMIPAIDHLAGLNPGYAGPLRFMQILARGHNKSSLEAWIAAFLLTCSKRIIKGYVLAADRDQGRLVLEALDDMLRLNPWVKQHVTVTKNRISGPAGYIEVLPFDAASGMGLRGNFFICDEFVHWKRQAEWSAVVSGLSKVKPTVFVAISNAGLLGSWQHDVWVEAQHDTKHYVTFSRPGTLASWLDPETLAADRRALPPSEAERLIDNEWIDPAREHDYLRRMECDACARLGDMMGLTYRLRRQFGVSNYVAAIDYAARKDRTALVVLHQDAERTVRIDRLDVWQGTPEAPIQISRVEEWIADVQQGFNPRVFVLDPYQMEGTIQWAQKRGLPVEAFGSRGGAANFEMAQMLRSLIVEQRLVWYEGAGELQVTDRRTGVTNRETLVDELAALRVKRMPYGYRFDHENQKHDDRAVAITMAALRAVEYPASIPTTPPPTGLVNLGAAGQR